VLHKCEWGKDDYSLQIAQLPAAEPDEGVQAMTPARKSHGKKPSAADGNGSLFDNATEGEEASLGQ
jgi:adenine-specific DNA-methyltransferase